MTSADASGSSDATTDVAIAIDSGALPDVPFMSAPHRPFPQVPNTAGKLLHSPTLVTIVASNETPSDGTDDVASLLAFSDAVPASAVWIAMSTEYGLGALTSGPHVTGPALTGAQTEPQLVEYVGALITAGSAPAPGGDTIYLVYLPAGASYSGSTDCGYHSAYPNKATSLGDQLATVRRCTPYADQETQLGQLTRGASHEIVESATDPLDEGFNLGEATTTPWNASVWQAWAEDLEHVELGDLCEGTRTFEIADGGPDGGWELQRMWSNAAAASGGDPCVPAYDEPYYQFSVPQDWYSVAAGDTVSIPVTGWSAAATTDWLLSPHLASTNDAPVFDTIVDGGVTVSSELGIATASGCSPRYGVNDGTSATVRVTAPATAQHGDYVVIGLHALREKPPPSCYPSVSEDEYHFWPVGVYVP